MNPLITGNGWHFYDESLTSAEVVKLLYEKIYEVCRKFDALILGCNTIGHLRAGYMLSLINNIRYLFHIRMISGTVLLMKFCAP